MPWSTFTNALYCISKKSLEADSNDERFWRRNFLSPFLEIYNNDSWPPLDMLMRNACTMSCTDDRDRIYALAPLGGAPLNKLKITPDYSLPVSEVYKDFMLKWMDFSETLGMMGVFETNASGPSWVPAYNSVPECDFWTCSYASYGITADVEYLGSNKLRVAGVQFATIEGVKPIPIAKYESGRVLSRIRDITPSDIQSKTYPTGCRASLALAATLVRTVDELIQEPADEGDISSSSAERILLKILERDSDPPPDRHDSVERYFLGAFYLAGKGRSLATTKEGYYVLAPKDAQPGDAVCTLLGLQNHIVLRPVGRGEYRVIGQCFAHGLNFGETLLGDLPTGWSKKYIYTEEFQHNGWVLEFKNLKTGKIQYEDPRFDGKKHKQEFFGNSVRSGSISTEEDQFMAIEVDLRDFILV